MEVDRQKKYCLGFEIILILELVLFQQGFHYYFQQVGDIDFNQHAKLLGWSVERSVDPVRSGGPQ